ncbi:glycosyltransferase [Actinoallomurus rhizosphaericola]|uniref:glycosyltransferase n=1 Tax=Actinoallomurus rhizosphaericola TaxID=2952536 RepID=UPI0027E346F6|nr:glycosyltransferase [Actinoallomurus rhizosphaericola]
MRCQLKDAQIAAVVVTHNRRDLLTEALTALEKQTRPPDGIVVVDNASADGTARLVRERFPGVRLLALPRNTGGAGGFATGIAHALATGADALWLLDDDTVPEPDALAALLTARDRGRDGGGRPPALVAGRVVWTDGRDHPMNTPRSRPSAVPGCARIRSASFVSVLVDAEAVRERGLPIADYFLWNDDFEFTLRLLRGRAGLLCRDSVAVHRTASPDFDPGRRFFHEVRNKVWLFTRSRCLGPGERLLYAGATARRWARTLAGSADRTALVRDLGRGLWAGLRSGPRPNDAVLTDTDSEPR